MRKMKTLIGGNEAKKESTRFFTRRRYQVTQEQWKLN